jgi:hypothetical protein
MLKQDDHLLYIVTHYRKPSWERFKAVFGELYKPSARVGEEPNGDTLASSLQQIRWRTVRALEWLRFCQLDFASGEGTVTAYGARLARLPTVGLPCAILCGARGPDTVNILAKVTRDAGARIAVHRQSPEIPYVPQRVFVQARSTRHLAEIAQRAGLKFSAVPLAHTTMDASTSLSKVLAATGWEDGGPLNWNRRVFNPSTLSFENSRVGRNELELHRYEDPIRGVPRYYLIDHGNNETTGSQARRGLVDLDWGRYAVLHTANRHVLLFDPESLMLAVPVSAPLPVTIAQSLALCSGFLPSVQSLAYADTPSDKPQERQYHLFLWVPAKLAQQAAAKVHQPLTEMHLAVACPALHAISLHVFAFPRLE